MALIETKPVTPSQRFYVKNVGELAKKRPEKSLTVSVHRKKGRNSYGRITSRRRGGGHKKLYRIIDFRRKRLDEPAEVIALEYDPNRSAYIALVKFEDGEKQYFLATDGVQVGDKLLSSKNKIDIDPGNCMPLKHIPPATKIHAIELLPGKGAQMVRSAGNSAQLINIDGNKAVIKLPSGEIRMVSSECRAVIGNVSNTQHQNRTIGKAGRSRWLGRRPRVRGVAMNPVDHPMGGGEGRTSGGGHPMSPWGQLAKGFPTRRRSKTTNSLILVRRNGKKFNR
ncbi:MAG: 50S ribosomal protein L2 [Opitutales bacterium]|nr:50S ribosomal protein L2 [Opitutales bacterium]